MLIRCLLYLQKPSMGMCSLTDQEIVFVAQYCCETNSYTLPTMMDLFQKLLLCVMCLRSCNRLNFNLQKEKESAAKKDTSLRLVQYIAHMVERNVENIIIRNRQYCQHSLAFPNQKQSVCWRGCLIHTCLNVCKTVY